MDRKAILKKELRSFISSVCTKFPDAKIIVFGSRARADFLQESDYDILVVSSKFAKMHFLKRMEELFLMWKVRADADLFGFTPDELEKRRGELGVVGTALKSGIVVS